MLLSSKEFSSKLLTSLNSANSRIVVLSAFIKLNALKWMVRNSNISDIKIVARWQKHDLICGASDFECYRFCKDHSIPFGVSTNLHGKVFSCDNHILVGSANLTSKGMALLENHNDEFGVGFEAGDGDESKIQNFLSKVVWVDDHLADVLEEELKNVDNSKATTDEKWSSKTRALFHSPVCHLWVHDLPFSTPEKLAKFVIDDENCAHDLDLLSVSIDEVSLQNLKNAFVSTNAFRWLNRLLDEEESLSFGKVTAELHNSLLDDPVPYRQDVKKLVSNLFCWAEVLPQFFRVTQPRHSLVLLKP